MRDAPPDFPPLETDVPASVGCSMPVCDAAPGSVTTRTPPDELEDCPETAPTEVPCTGGGSLTAPFRAEMPAATRS